MAKISISRVLARRKWTKIGSAVAVLVLGFFMVQLLIIKNPWGARAAWSSAGTTCTLDGGPKTLPSGDTTCDDKDVVISGSTSILTVEGTHNFKSVATSNGGQLISAANAVTTTSGASIKKTLIPYKREGAPGPATCQDNYLGEPIVNCFNPYALQLNDIIKVNIDISNAPIANHLLVDDYLRVPGGNYVCSANVLPNPIEAGGPGKYNNTPSLNALYISVNLINSNNNFYYYCKVIQQ